MLTKGRMARQLNVAPGVTTMVGSGGKTSLLLTLAEELSQRASVIVTTSTHIWPPEGMPVLLDPDSERIKKELEERRLICVGHREPNGKLTACNTPVAILCQIAEYVLVEGDGAKGRPLKAPDEWEPVIPQETRLVLAVAGLDGIGRSVESTVFRPERYGKLIGESDPEHIVTTEDVARVLIHPNGQRKGVLPGMDFQIVLNKADTRWEQELACQVSETVGPSWKIWMSCLQEEMKC